MGNEAIAQGALESEISFATGYPGTPSTEIIETIACLNPEILLNGPLPRLVTPRSFTMGYSLWWILFTVVILDNRTTTMTEHQHTTQEQVEVKREGNLIGDIGQSSGRLNTLRPLIHTI